MDRSIITKGIEKRQEQEMSEKNCWPAASRRLFDIHQQEASKKEKKFLLGCNQLTGSGPQVFIFVCAEEGIYQLI